MYHIVYLMRVLMTLFNENEYCGCMATVQSMSTNCCNFSFYMFSVVVFCFFLINKKVTNFKLSTHTYHTNTYVQQNCRFNCNKKNLKKKYFFLKKILKMKKMTRTQRYFFYFSFTLHFLKSLFTTAFVNFFYNFKSVFPFTFFFCCHFCLQRLAKKKKKGYFYAVFLKVLWLSYKLNLFQIFYYHFRFHLFLFF